MLLFSSGRGSHPLYSRFPFLVGFALALVIPISCTFSVHPYKHIGQAFDFDFDFEKFQHPIYYYHLVLELVVILILILSLLTSHHLELQLKLNQVQEFDFIN